MNKLLQIYVVYHKETPLIKSDIFIPIQGGRSTAKTKLEIIGDDTGLNISHKNNRFCELTVLYWMRYNAPESDFIGLNHYRRFFYLGWNDDINRQYFIDQNIPVINITNINEGIYACLQYQSLFGRILSNCDIILPNAQNLGSFTLRERYLIDHDFSFRELVDVLINLHPLYANQIQQICDSHWFYPCNMFIMKTPLFQQYIDWLFTILDKLEPRMPKTERLIGFLSERLFTFYIQLFLSTGKFKIKHFPILFLGNHSQITVNYNPQVMNYYAYVSKKLQER